MATNLVYVQYAMIAIPTRNQDAPPLALLMSALYEFQFTNGVTVGLSTTDDLDGGDGAGGDTAVPSVSASASAGRQRRALRRKRAITRRRIE
jgi:hypothetical protein